MSIGVLGTERGCQAVAVSTGLCTWLITWSLAVTCVPRALDRKPHVAVSPLSVWPRARNWRNGSRILSPLCRDMCPCWEEPCSASTCSPGSPDDRDLPSHCSLGAGGLWHGQGAGGEGWYVTLEPEAADSTEGKSTVCLCLDTKTEAT